MNTRWVRVLIAVVAVLAMLTAVSVAVNTAAPAQADGSPSGGITGASNAVTVLDGTTAYTVGVNSDAFEARYYGSMQVMAAVDMTGTQTITVTPQFSLQNLPCGQVTQWFNATSYVSYQPAAATTVTATEPATATETIATGLEVSGTLVTTTTNWITTTNWFTSSLAPGDLTRAALSDLFTLTGSGTAQREVDSGGLCFRASLTWSNSGETYTPTIVVRGVNRGK